MCITIENIIRDNPKFVTPHTNFQYSPALYINRQKETFLFEGVHRSDHEDPTEENAFFLVREVRSRAGRIELGIPIICPSKEKAVLYAEAETWVSDRRPGFTEDDDSPEHLCIRKYTLRGTPPDSRQEICNYTVYDTDGTEWTPPSGLHVKGVNLTYDTPFMTKLACDLLYKGRSSDEIRAFHTLSHDRRIDHKYIQIEDGDWDELDLDRLMYQYPNKFVGYNVYLPEIVERKLITTDSGTFIYLKHMDIWQTSITLRRVKLVAGKPVFGKSMVISNEDIEKFLADPDRNSYSPLCTCGETQPRFLRKNSNRFGEDELVILNRLGEKWSVYHEHQKVELIATLGLTEENTLVIDPDTNGRTAALFIQGACLCELQDSL